MMEMRYFSSVPGRAFKRIGRTVYIGCRYKKDHGFVWTDNIVAIPVSEVNANRRDYDQAVKNGDLKSHTQDEYEAANKPSPAKKPAVKAKAKAKASELEPVTSQEG